MHVQLWTLLVYISLSFARVNQLVSRSHIDQDVCDPISSTILQLIFSEAAIWAQLAVVHTVVDSQNDFDDNLFRAAFAIPHTINEAALTAKAAVRNVFVLLFLELTNVIGGRALFRCDEISGCENHPFDTQRPVVTFTDDAWIYLVRSFTGIRPLGHRTDSNIKRERQCPSFWSLPPRNLESPTADSMVGTVIRELLRCRLVLHFPLRSYARKPHFDHLEQAGPEPTMVFEDVDSYIFYIQGATSL